MKRTLMNPCIMAGVSTFLSGRITVASKPGVETTFTAYLPAAAAEARREETATGTASLPATGSETVLVVEDDERLRSLNVATLEKCGYAVLAAADGQEAVALAASHDGPIHLLVTDLLMPKIGGAEVAAQLAESHPNLKVLLISGYAPEGSGIPEACAAGAAFLAKPFMPTTLAQKVRKLLDA